jgi:periplasmic protein TonB
MKRSISRPAASAAAAVAAAIAAVLAGCSSRPLPPEPSRPPVAVVPAPAPAKPAPPPPQVASGKTSNAATPRDYRRDAAGHLYSLHPARIYKGKLPPLLYAVGVLQVEIDAQGRVLGTSWMRAPNHAPEVVAEIERTVRQAAPYPAPARLGRVTYTDTWLWDKSGRFQLDTLTEGQL